jgi:hypothetical protein
MRKIQTYSSKYVAAMSATPKNIPTIKFIGSADFFLSTIQLIQTVTRRYVFRFLQACRTSHRLRRHSRPRRRPRMCIENSRQEFSFFLAFDLL